MAQPAFSSPPAKKAGNPHGKKRISGSTTILRLAWLPIPVLLGAIFALWLMDLPTVIEEPAFLLGILTFSFRAAAPLLIAYVAARGFSRNGSLPLLGLGCGMLFFGSTSLISGLAVQYGEVNLALTVENTGLWFSGISHLLAAVTALTPQNSIVRNARLAASLTYALVLLLVSLLTFAALDESTPIFFVQGEEPQILRQAVLFIATVTFFLASILVAVKAQQRDWIFGRWYAMSLTLIGIGIMGFIPPAEAGSPVNWIGRAAQYLGVLYLLAAVVIAGRQSGEWNTTLQDALEDSEQRLRMLAEATFEGILISEEGVIIDANDQIAEILGYKREDLIGRPIPPFIPDEFTSRVMKKIQAGADSTLEHPLIRRDGTKVIVETHGRTLRRHGRKIRFTAIRDTSQRNTQEQALRRANKRVLHILESISDGFVTLDQDWNYTYVNRAAAESLNTTAEELTGQNFWERWPDVRKLNSGQVLRQCLSQGKPLQYDEFYPPLGRWYSCRCYPSAEGITLLFSDVTEQKQAEEALRETKEANERNLARLDAIVNQMTEGLIIFDPQGNLLEMNPVALAMHGFTNMDLLRRNLTELPDVFELSDESGKALPLDQWPIGRVLKGETFNSYEVRVRRVDTGRSWIGSYGGAPVYDEEGKIQLAIVTLRDVTDHKRAEQALRESEQRFRTVVERSRDGIHQFDVVHGRYIFVSPSIEDLTGFTRDELKAMSAKAMLRRVHPEDRNRVASAFKKALKGETSAEPMEYRWQTKDGNFRWFSESRGILRNAKGDVISLIGVSRDITVRKEQEQALAKSREELEQRVAERTTELEQRADQLARLSSELTLTEQRERGRLAQVLHDHLQQLLVGAKYNLTLLARKMTENEKAALVQVEELLNESIEASRSLTVELSPPILHEGGLPAGMRWLARWAQQKFGITVKLDIDEDARVDREDLRIMIFQAVRELLVNISKYAKTSEALLTLAKQQGGELRVSVKDHGIGFDPARVLGNQKITGGFGLFSIRERLKLLGGEFIIESAPGQGSQFTLITPVPDPLLHLRPEEKGEPFPGKGSSREPGIFRPPRSSDARTRILLADDHAVMRQGLSALLAVEKDLVIVGEAADGREAVEMARELRPDVILMDFSMPRLDGVQATEIIHKEQSRTQIIGLSMYEEDDRAATMLKAGAAEYVTKSGKSEELLRAIRKVAVRGRSFSV